MTPRSRKVNARAWCRVDFAGGTLDIWPLGLLHDGSSTINVAVDCAVDVSLSADCGGSYVVEQGGEEIREVELKGLLGRRRTALVGLVAELYSLEAFRCRIRSGSPQGGGLGASSALTVALIRAAELWSGSAPRSAAAVMRLARDLEARLMALPTGTQDHAAALHGGALELIYPPGDVVVRGLREVDLERLGDHLLLVYSGQSHFSAGSNWQVVRRRLDGDREITRCFEGLADTAREISSTLKANDLPSTGRLMSREWSFRRQLSEGIATPVIEELLGLATSRGAWGGKACGAGGGGCIALLCPPEVKASLRDLYRSEGYRVIEARPTGRPLRAWMEDPEGREAL